jgi:class 3 adenylate cyclase
MADPIDDLVAAGRDALDHHAWDDAYDALTRADRAGSLDGDGLRLLAQAAYWAAHPEETVEDLERAYGAYLDQGDRKTASMMAFRVAEQHGMRMNLPQAQGWAARAQHLAEDDLDWPVHGWLVWMHGLVSWFGAEFEAAVVDYEQAADMATRSGDADLHWMSVHDRGHALCLLGRVKEGVALLDEAMAAVIGGEVGPDAAGYVYCGMIGACSKLGDYGRAAEWTESTLRWCERESVPAFPGVCRIHRAELKRLHGSLAEAEEEALMACEELPRFNFFSGLGPAQYEIGEIRRRRGDLRGAEEAYTTAHGYGYDPQPGLSLVHLQQGKVESAIAEIQQALRAAGDNRCRRVRLLAAMAEIGLAAGDLEAAASADEELASVVTDFDAVALRSLAACTHGAVTLARGDASGAIPDLRRAQAGWQEVDAPYEVAEAHLVLGQALHALGDDDAAILELRAARSGFERVGARSGAEQAGRLLGDLHAATEVPDRVTRAFMFTDIVKSTDLVGLIGDEAWEDLLAWHDQALASRFALHGGEIAHHTGDGFFVAFEDARSALSCAVDVQRALAEHRRAHGFAPRVRIGVHTAEAIRRGMDFSGVEVHKAARIASAAQGGEILATIHTVEAAGDDFRTVDPRSVTLKGVTEPVEVTRIEWD